MTSSSPSEELASLANTAPKLALNALNSASTACWAVLCRSWNPWTSAATSSSGLESSVLRDVKRSVSCEPGPAT